MMRRMVSLIAASCIFVLGGCGGGSEQEKPTAKTADRIAPDRVVHNFLEAVRVGNDEQAAGLLTPVAREQTAKMDLVVAPPGSDTARFEVGEVRLEGNDAAYVQSVWTDDDENGQPHSDEIVWVLRLEDEGWRIAGMATEIFPGEDPLILNFEDPQDMLEQQRMAEEEMDRRAQEAIRQVRQPADAPAAAR